MLLLVLLRNPPALLLRRRRRRRLLEERQEEEAQPVLQALLHPLGRAINVVKAAPTLVPPLVRHHRGPRDLKAEHDPRVAPRLVPAGTRGRPRRRGAAQLSSPGRQWGTLERSARWMARLYTKAPPRLATACS